MKRILLAASLVFLFCGCGTDTIRAAPASEKQNLTVALWDYGKVSYDKRLIEAFESENPGVSVTVISFPDSYYDQKVESLLTSGRQVDVVYLRTSASLQSFAAQDMLYPVDDFVGETLKSEGVMDELDAMYYQEHPYAIPYRRDRYVLLYNCDIFDRAGVPYPTDGMSWQQFQEMARTLQPHLQADEYAVMTLPMNIQWIASMNSGPLEQSAEGAEALRPMLELVTQMETEDHSMMPYGDSMAQNIQQRSFETGKYGMYLGGTWYLNYLTTDQQAEKFDFHWGVVEQPRWPGQADDSLTAIMTSIAIGQNAADPALAWSFIRFVSGKQGAELMAEEQMMPAYMDDDVAQIYRSHFQGQSLSEGVMNDRAGRVNAMPTEEHRRWQALAEQVFQDVAVQRITVEEGMQQLRAFQ